MSSISPWFRGYRLALRNVQRAIDRHAHGMVGQPSAASAVFMACDEIAFELRCLKDHASSPRRDAQSQEDAFRFAIRPTYGSSTLSDNVLFGDGYRRGFDRAITLVTRHGARMNDAKARVAMEDVVKRLERLQVELEAQAKDLTSLKKRHYAL